MNSDDETRQIRMPLHQEPVTELIPGLRHHPGFTKQAPEMPEFRLAEQKYLRQIRNAVRAILVIIILSAITLLASTIMLVLTAAATPPA